jgi:protein tyrosine phosphatase (PTP) superfamily phosphohydrolase (DUF442 family)
MQDVKDIVPGMMNVRSPMEGVATAGQPEKEHLEKLSEAGYKTVLDLRTPGEERGFDEAETVREAGMEYENIPLTAEPGSFDDDSFERFRDVMRRSERRPVLVHCGSGVRVAPMMIPYLVLDEGKSPGEAVEAAGGIGPRREDLNQVALDYAERRRGD